MPEHETIADGIELAFREKAMWLLIRRAGGRVVISAEEWGSVPPLPEVVFSRDGDAMVWTAKERDDERGPDRGYPSAADRAMVSRATCGGIRSREIQAGIEPEPASPVAAELDPPEIDVPLPFPEEP